MYILYSILQVKSRGRRKKLLEFLRKRGSFFSSFEKGKAEYAHRKIEKGGCGKYRKCNEYRTEDITSKTLKKQVAKLSQKGKGKKGEKCDKKLVIAYLPPFFL